MKNLIRNLLSIRQQRKAAPVGSLPPVGASIIRSGLKMKVTHAMTREMWDWLVLSGWRNVPVKNDRRSYQQVPEAALRELMDAPPEERNKVHSRIVAQAKAGDT
ncbi:hypothetical protein ACDW_06080 [Acidovorax sp. DW039]|uniref:hypothetical protein n=1 Tax=Acidovorax sp. DW039 TaxID=3095606 RepID=UPI0030847D84|nr:hypothetical protein ACDW_06080 [Acidovorax sp. DW039]